MTNGDTTGLSRWKMVCLNLGMSEEDISTLLCMSAAERTAYLIELLEESENSDVKVGIVTILGGLGDLEETADFYIQILRGGEPRLKFRAALEGGMARFAGCARLGEAIAAHLGRWGASSEAEAYGRELFPNGACPLRRGHRRSSNTEEQQPPEVSDKTGNKRR